jgi:hypothetical protein
MIGLTVLLKRISLSASRESGDRHRSDLLIKLPNTKKLQMGFALKVVVAPKVGFLPQKSFRSVIRFADHDLSAAISEFVLCWPPGFSLVGLLVGLKEFVRLVLFDL